MTDQVILFVTLLLALVLCVYGRWRYDLAALMALLIVVAVDPAALKGPREEIFSGRQQGKEERPC